MSRMNREVQVRICEGLGVKLPGPTRHGLPLRLRWHHDRCTSDSCLLAAPEPRSPPCEGGIDRPTCGAEYDESLGEARKRHGRVKMANRARWMIYGANGYTGHLVAVEARRQGLYPVLAGRRAGPIETLAEDLGLPARVFDLGDARAAAAALADMAGGVPLPGPLPAPRPATGEPRPPRPNPHPPHHRRHRAFPAPQRPARR